MPKKVRCLFKTRLDARVLRHLIRDETDKCTRTSTCKLQCT